MEISEIVAKKFEELRNTIKDKNSYNYQIKCEIENEKRDYRVQLYIHDWIRGISLPETKKEIYLLDDELQELLKELYQEDVVVTVAAKASDYQDSAVSIIGVESEIIFDDATMYSDMIKQANSEALLKDSMVNRDITIEGKEFKYWKFITLNELCRIPNFQIAFLKCAVLLESWTNDDITEENIEDYMKQRILNRIENVDEFLVYPNHITDSYLVKSQREKTKVNRVPYSTGDRTN